MFDNLIESKAKRQTTLGQTVVSVLLHAGLIFGAIKATQGVAETIAERQLDTTAFIIKAPAPEPPPPPPPEDVIVSANPPPKGFQTVVAVADIPKDIPPIDLNQKPFDPRDFTGKGVEGGISTGVIGGSGPVDVGSVVVSSAEADEAPRLITAGPKQTPAGMEGVAARVEMEFIVGTNGKVEPGSVTVLSSTSKVFEAPAKAMILKSVFKPGMLAGQPVRVKVRQGVTFT